MDAEPGAWMMSREAVADFLGAAVTDKPPRVWNVCGTCRRPMSTHALLPIAPNLLRYTCPQPGIGISIVSTDPKETPA